MQICSIHSLVPASDDTGVVVTQEYTEILLPLEEEYQEAIKKKTGYKEKVKMTRIVNQRSNNENAFI